MDLLQLAAYLEGFAKKKRTVYYSNVVNHFGLPPLTGTWNSHPLSAAFGSLDREDKNAGRPFRTSIVIAKETNMPGPGYFKTLADLKQIYATTEAQKLAIFTRELQATFSHPW